VQMYTSFSCVNISNLQCYKNNDVSTKRRCAAIYCSGWIKSHKSYSVPAEEARL